MCHVDEALTQQQQQLQQKQRRISSEGVDWEAGGQGASGEEDSADLAVTVPIAQMFRDHCCIGGTNASRQLQLMTVVYLLLLILIENFRKVRKEVALRVAQC